MFRPPGDVEVGLKRAAPNGGHYPQVAQAGQGGVEELHVAWDVGDAALDLHRVLQAVAAEDAGAPGGGPEHAEQETNGGGLAGSPWPRVAEHLSPTDGEGHAVNAAVSPVVSRAGASCCMGPPPAANRSRGCAGAAGRRPGRPEAGTPPRPSPPDKRGGDGRESKTAADVRTGHNVR